MFRLIALIGLCLIVVACASSNSGSVYRRDETHRVQTVKTGSVESIRAVKLEGTKSGVGMAAGAVVGGVAGSTVAMEKAL